MDAFDLIAERKLAEAVAAGELDHLPGAGQPLELEELASLDEELRAGYLLLRSAGVLPEEMQLQKELLNLGDLLRACQDAEERATLEGRRRALALQYDVWMERARRT